MSGESGATAVELFAGLMLTAVLVLAARPLFGELVASYELRGAAHEVFAQLQRTRLAAVMRNNPHRFTVLVGSSRYEIHDDANADAYEDPGEVTTMRLGVERVSLEGASTLTFLANGTVLAPGEISVVNREGERRVIVVDTGGSIRIK